MFRSNPLKATLKFASLAMAFCAVGMQAHAQLTAPSTATSQVTVTSGLGNTAGLAVDPLGNIYVADSVNNVLLQITGANGAPSTVLTGLTTPGQLAVDFNRNVYIADGTSNVVMKFIYTAGALNLNTPVNLGTGLGTVTGVAVDLTGNVYIVDSGKKQIVKVTTAGVQSTLATGLINPKQIAVDRNGDVFYADAGANAVYFLAGGAGTPVSVGTGFNAPSGVVTDSSNNLYVADTGNSLVKEIPYSGTAPVTTGQTTLPVTVTAPTTIAVDSRNTLYVGGSGNIVHFSSGAIYYGLIQTKQATQVTPVTITFTTAVQPAVIKVVTTGYTGLDFADAGGGTCAAGVSYTAGQSCTVNTTFTPLFPGARMGAIVFYDSTNKVVSRIFLGGGGLGPLMTIDSSIVGTTVPVSAKSILPGNFAGSSAIALNGPHGVHSDAIGNLFFADTNSNRVIEIPANGGAPTPVSLGTQALNDATIDGAGDLVVPDLSAGRITITPYENGTWNNADLGVLAVGTYPRIRTINVDVAGTSYYCDATDNKIYVLPFYGVPVQIAAGLTKGCLGVAVDLYGNIGVSDATALNALYIPVSGQTPYTVGTGFSGTWGIAFDASGSLYVGQGGVTTLFRIPNENGTLATADQVSLYGSKAYGIGLDPMGNLYTVSQYSSTVTTGYLLVPRSAPITVPLATGSVVYQPALNFTPTVSTYIAVGAAASTPVAFTIGNAGNQIPTYSYPAGLALLMDLDDFPVVTANGNPNKVIVAKPPPLPLCDFTTSFQPAFSCYVGIGFTPQSPGSTRTATAFVPTQGVTTALLALSGTSSGTAATTAANLAVALTSPAGTPGPFQALTVTASVASAATGSITLYVDGVGLPATEVAAGVASFSLPAGLSAGAHTVTATYSGDKTYAPVTTPVSIAPALTVASAKGTLTIATSGTNISPGQALTIAGTVAGQTGLSTPTGTLTFLDGATTIGTATLGNTHASFTTTALAAGTHTLSYVYSGDSTYAMGNSPTATVVVGTYTPTTTALTVTPVQPAGGYVYGTALTVVVAVTPATVSTGNILLNFDGAFQTAAVSGGMASFTITPNAGSHTLIASFSGNSTYASSSATSTFITNKVATVTTLAASSTAFAAGSNVTLTATVTSPAGVPTGTVVFRNKNTPLGTVAVNSKGVAVLTTSALPGGADPVTASYSGDSDNNPSTSPAVTLNAAFNPTAVVVTSSTLIVYSTSSPNSLTATLTVTAPASVVIAPSGTVTFTLNGTAIGTVALSAGTPTATITLTTAQLISGVNKVTATYSGDNDYLSSTTPTPLSFYVVPVSGYNGDYSLSATPNPLTISIGTIANGTITVTPIGGYFGYVQLTCAGLPLYTNCIMQPDQVFLDGTGTPQIVALSVLSQAPVLVGALSPQQSAMRLAGMLGAPFLLALVLGSFRRGRRWLRSAGVKGLLAMFFLCAALGSMTACGGHPPIATAAGTYTVQIAATGSGSINHSLPVQMIFK